MCLCAYGYDDSSSRIKKTTHNEEATKMGDPMTITWSIVPDGTKMPRFKVESRSDRESNFIARMDTLHGGAPDPESTDLSKRPWFGILVKAFDKYALKTGLTYIYEPNDSGDSFNYTSSVGEKDVLGDVRIGGLALGATLDLRAYSGMPGASGYAPNIVFNTHHKFFESADLIDFLLVHENMHNVGIGHVLVNSDPMLTAVAKIGKGAGNGPQFDDLLGLHRRYGDVYEKKGGNDSKETAVDLGPLKEGPLRIGFDAGTLKVENDQIDFVSIDGSSDVDYYKVTIEESRPIIITLSPRGSEFEYIMEDEGDRSKK